MRYRKRSEANKPFAKQHNLPKEIDDLSFTELMKLQKIVIQMEKDMRKEIQEDERRFSLKFLIYIMINVMSGEGYWEKSYKKRIPKLFSDMTKLADVIGERVVSWEEVESLAHESGDGFNIDDDFIDRVVGYRTDYLNEKKEGENNEHTNSKRKKS